MEISSVINRFPSLQQGVDLTKIQNDLSRFRFPIVHDIARTKLTLPLLSNIPDQIVDPFGATLEQQQYSNSHSTLGVLNNAAFQSGELLNRHYGNALNDVDLHDLAEFGPKSVSDSFKLLSRFSADISSLSNKVMSENYLPDYMKVFPDLQNTSAYLYQSENSILGRTRSTLNNVLGVPKQSDIAISTQYSEASIVSPEDSFSERIDLENEVGSEFHSNTSALQSLQPLDNQIPTIAQILSANPISKIITRVPSELYSMSSQMGLSNLPFVSTFNLRSLFPSFHESALAHISQNGLSHLFSQPLIPTSLENFQNKFNLPSVKGILDSRYSPTTIGGYSDHISADKTELVSNVAMDDTSGSVHTHDPARKTDLNAQKTLSQILKEHISNKGIDWRPLINTAYYGITTLGSGANSPMFPALTRRINLTKNHDADIQHRNLHARDGSSVNKLTDPAQLDRHILANENFERGIPPTKRLTPDFVSIHSSPYSITEENGEVITNEESEELELRSLGTKLEQIFNDELRKYGVYNDQISSSHYHDDLFDYKSFVEENGEVITNEESEELELRSLGTKLEQIFNDELRKYGY